MQPLLFTGGSLGLPVPSAHAVPVLKAPFATHPQPTPNSLSMLCLNVPPPGIVADWQIPGCSPCVP